MSRQLSRQSAWFLFGLSFIVVYREVFETILFYAALWTHGNGGAMLAGAGLAVLLLGLIAWTVLRSRRAMPIAQFSAYSSWLMTILPHVHADTGVSALPDDRNIVISLLVAAPRVASYRTF